MATARGDGDRKLKPVLIFSAAFAGTCAVLLLPFVHSADGVRTFYQQTIGFQTGRQSPMTIWGLGLAPEFLQTLAKLGAVALGILVAFRPKVRSTAQVAALAAAVLVALEIAGDHWFYLYIVWFAGPLLFALFSEYRTGASEGPAAATSAIGRKRTRGDVPARGSARLGSASS